ncbi:MAG: hypothetical protein HQM14_14275 [SAR324 cluster bacterium]|nr:hypothetical protein [SAR324 cluster bacterium]
MTEKKAQETYKAFGGKERDGFLKEKYKKSTSKYDEYLSGQQNRLAKSGVGDDFMARAKAGRARAVARAQDARNNLIQNRNAAQ